MEIEEMLSGKPKTVARSDTSQPRNIPIAPPENVMNIA
jgi:hypothetical protein